MIRFLESALDVVGAAATATGWGFGDVGIDWKSNVPCVGEQLQFKLGLIR